MKSIFINLKRFDVPRSAGGLADTEDAADWIETIVGQSVEEGMGSLQQIRLVYLVPESALIPALNKREAYAPERRANLALGVQGVHWENVEPGGNFGAFTSLLPAAAAANLGAEWAIIGHSEERRAKAQLLAAYDARTVGEDGARRAASQAINELIGDEVECAFRSGLNVLLCIGESAAERGGGTFAEQKPNIEKVLRSQLLTNLGSLPDGEPERELVIGYEPIWAIGPGRTPPGKEYIAFVSGLIKEIARSELGLADLPVVYGGGLKKENAAMIAGIETIDGGLVALTRFTGEIGFSVPELKEIVDHYRQLVKEME